MAVVARGSLADRSVPRLFAALAARGFDGELVIEGGPRPFRIAWERGAIVGAQSPHPSDGAVKIAVTLGVLSSTQAGEVARVIAGNPGVDELELIAQSARLPTELVGRLARRVAGGRAARAISIEQGTYTVDDELPYWGNVAPVDARWVLYSGLRAHYPIERAERELAPLASVVRLRAGADLDGFGFGDAEAPVLDKLRTGTGELWVAPVMAGVDPQVAQAVALALLLTGEAEVARPPVTSTPAPITGPVPVVAAARPPPPEPPSAPPAPAPVRVVTPPKSAPPREVVARPTTAAADKIKALIGERIAILDAGGDHFALLGVTAEAGPDEIRSKYFALARHLHPDRLKAVGIDDDKRDAQRLFARINEAFNVLTDPEKRARYQHVQAAGGEAAVKAREAAAEAAVRRALEAEERFSLGEMALRRQQVELALREFEKAVELNPDEADHHAMLGWATYVGATNKPAAVPTARGHLQRALERDKKCVAAYLALGRIARIEGQDAEALKHFNQVLALAPGHADAVAELRALESRGKSAPPPDKKPGGLFSKLTRKP